MGADVTVRPSREEDMPAVTEIYGASVREETASFELVPPDEAEMRRRRHALLGAGYPYLVADLNGRVAGYAYASAYRPRPAYSSTVENSVYVARWAQRRGVGRCLMEELIRACSATGRRQMIAIIGGSAHKASIELHRSLGFEMVGVLKDVGWKHAQWLDTVLMQLPLGPGASLAPGAETEGGGA